MPILKEIKPYSDNNGNTITGTLNTNSANSFVDFRGKNCKLIIHEGVVLEGSIQFLQDDATVEIGERCVIRGGMQLGRGASVIIGRKLDVTGSLTIVVDDEQTVSIGNDCLFAAGVNLRAYDNHPIYDLRTGKRTNYSRPITIGANVWMGFQSAALAGSVIPDGCIIGLRSVVTASSKLDRHTLAVGQPVRVVKKYVTFAKNGNPPADSIDLSLHPDAATLYDLTEPEKTLKSRAARFTARIYKVLIAKFSS